MTKSPCIKCEFELADKNNPTCRECELRVAYVASIGDMTHSVPEESISAERLNRKEIGGIMEEIKETEVRDQKSEIGNQDKNLCVICHDKDKKILNKRSQTCGACYQKWNAGNIEHPTLGKFVPSLIRSKAKPAKIKRAPVKKKEVKKQKSEVGSRKSERAAPAEVKKAALPPLVAVQLSLYPEIHKAVYDTAEKYFVTPEHVIIGLIGEALAGRKERP